jgi:ech hydrogenase subunit D
MTDGEILEIDPEKLVSKVLKIKHDGYRLVQICATKTKEGYELTYSFAKEYEFVCLRINVTEETEIMTISNIYSCAFLYENEICDLFGLQIKLITVDYKGNLYRIATETPFK